MTTPESDRSGWWMTEAGRKDWRDMGLQALVGIAPIYKLSWDLEPEFVGTGFWINHTGLLITAAHVIEANFDKSGNDVGYIVAFQTTPDLRLFHRMILRSDRHPTFDLALCETERFVDENGKPIPSEPLELTTEMPPIGSPVFTHAFSSRSASFAGEKFEGIPAGTYEGGFVNPKTGKDQEIEFVARLGFGQVMEIFTEARDKVMMPFPCFRSDIPVYGGNSGGPVFDHRGRICGVNCSQFQGTDIAFHVPLEGILGLRVKDVELIPEDPTPRNRTVFELGLARRVPFKPSLAKAYIPLWPRVILRPYLFVQYWIGWLRWKFRWKKR